MWMAARGARLPDKAASAIVALQALLALLIKQIKFGFQRVVANAIVEFFPCLRTADDCLLGAMAANGFVDVFGGLVHGPESAERVSTMTAPAERNSSSVNSGV